MTQGQFARVKELFDQAVSLSPEARREFLFEACPDDEEVRMEVERVLGQVTEGDLLEGARRAVVSALETAGARSDRGDIEKRERLIGRTLSHYRILEELGRGGMGIVYRALDVKLNREVALKVLPSHLVSDPDRKRRFVREAQSAAALKHPNIAVVYEIDEVDGETLIAMELIEGETLTDVLERGPLPVQRALEIATGVANGLGKAHEKGIVHRDVKPGNIMIAEDGQAKVIDFGLSKLLPLGGLQAETGTENRDDTLSGGPPAPTGGPDTLPGTLMGTVSYMSPEQVRGGDVDARSDVFSLGTVLYEMLSQRKAFQRETAAKTLTAILSKKPPDLDVSVSLMRIIRQCLEKSPDGRFRSAGALASTLDRQLGREPGDKSIAILPFINMSSDPENEYFSDGMSEEIINALNQLEGVRVASRTSSFSFKGRLIDIAEVGVKLNVDLVLEGSVRKAGNRLRITSQLINVADGYHLWSERYDRRWGDVFAIQEEIATAIVDHLKVALAGGRRSSLIKPTTQNLDAYQLYLQGRFFWNRRELRQAIECLESAIALDADYALAHAALADAYAMLGFGYGAHPAEVRVRAKQAAARSLELDETLAEAHYSLAYVSFVYEREWSTAAREFVRALELNPRYVAARYMYGFFLWLVDGETDRAIAEGKRAVEVDPLDSHAIGMLSIFLWAGGRSREAIPLLAAAVERDPRYFFLHRCLGMVYLAESRHQEAIAAFDEATRLSRRDVVVVMDLAVAHAHSGHTEKAEEILDELTAWSRREYASPTSIAAIQLALGRKKEATLLLERAIEEGDPILVVVKNWGHFRSLQGDPHYESLLKRIGWTHQRSIPTEQSERLS